MSGEDPGGQTPGLTNRNHIEGITGRTSLLNKTKSNTARILWCKCGGHMGGKLLLLPEGGLTDVSRIVRKRSKACRKKSAEAIVPVEKKKKSREGLNNRMF